MKKKRWPKLKAPKDQFTYQRVTKGDIVRIEFLNNGVPMFLQPVACTPDEALTLIQQLNSIGPRYLPTNGKKALDVFIERLNKKADEPQNAITSTSEG